MKKVEGSHVIDCTAYLLKISIVLIME